MIRNPAGLHDPVGFGYSHLAEVGDLVYVAGQYASDLDGHVTSADFEEQVERSFENLGIALGSAGLGFADVFQLRTYIVDHDEKKLEILGRQIQARWGALPPVQTLTGVARLALPEMLFEVDATAVRDRSGIAHGRAALSPRDVLAR